MKVYWDIPNMRLLSSASSVQTLSSVIWTARDIVPVTLYTGQITDAGAWVLADIEAGMAARFCAKSAQRIQDETHAALQQGIWTRTAEGTYTGLIDLRDAQMLSELGYQTSLDLVGEFALVDADGANYNSTHFAIQVRPDVFRGTELAQGLRVVNTSLVDEVVENGIKVVRIKNSGGTVLMALPTP